MIIPSLDQPTRTTDAIVAALAEAGVEYVLGMPGGYTGTLFSSLHDHPTIRVVQVREESIGSAMAEAYGRTTGQPVVVMGQGEWIAGNAGQGFLEALLGSSPDPHPDRDVRRRPALPPRLLPVGHRATTGAGTRVSALRGVTKRVMVSHDPAQAVQHTQLAIKHALVGRARPGRRHLPRRRPEGNGRSRLGTAHLSRPAPTCPRRSAAVDAEVLDARGRGPPVRHPAGHHRRQRGPGGPGR